MAEVKATLSVLPLTPYNEPVQASLEPREQYITKVVVWFRRNQAGLVGVALFDRENRILPDKHSLDDWLYGDGQRQEFEMDYDLGAGPHLLHVRAYSDDDLYTRKIEVTVTVFDVSLRRLAEQRSRTD